MAETPDEHDSLRSEVPPLARYFLVGFGLLSLGLGIAGMFLPLLPTVPFLLLAAWCFERASRRLERWLSGHPVLGKAIREWREERVIPLRAKLVALASIVLSAALVGYRVEPLVPRVLAWAVLLGVCVYLLTIPDAPRSAKEPEPVPQPVEVDQDQQ